MCVEGTGAWKIGNVGGLHSVGIPWENNEQIVLKQNVSLLKLRYQMDSSPLPNPAMRWNASQDTSLSKISCFQEAFFKLLGKVSPPPQTIHWFQ